MNEWMNEWMTLSRRVNLSGLKKEESVIIMITIAFITPAVLSLFVNQMLILYKVDSPVSGGVRSNYQV